MGHFSAGSWHCFTRLSLTALYSLQLQQRNLTGTYSDGTTVCLSVCHIFTLAPFDTALYQIRHDTASFSAQRFSIFLLNFFPFYFGSCGRL